MKGAALRAHWLMRPAQKCPSALLWPYWHTVLPTWLAARMPARRPARSEQGAIQVRAFRDLADPDLNIARVTGASAVVLSEGCSYRRACRVAGCLRKVRIALALYLLSTLLWKHKTHLAAPGLHRA